MAVPTLAHRVVLRPELWVRQVSSDDVIASVLATVPTPRTDPSAAEPPRPEPALPSAGEPGQGRPPSADRAGRRPDWSTGGSIGGSPGTPGDCRCWRWPAWPWPW